MTQTIYTVYIKMADDLLRCGFATKIVNPFKQTISESFSMMDHKQDIIKEPVGSSLFSL